MSFGGPDTECAGDALEPADDLLDPHLDPLASASHRRQASRCATADDRPRSHAALKTPPVVFSTRLEKLEGSVPELRRSVRGREPHDHQSNA